MSRFTSFTSFTAAPLQGVSLMKKFIHTTLCVAIALVCTMSRAHAASTLDVNITFTIGDIVAVQWNDTSTTAKTWAIGTVALNTTYTTVTPDGSWAAGPLSIDNVSSDTNSTVDIDLQITSGPAAGWTDGAANGADVYVVKAAIGATVPADVNAGTIIRSATPAVDFVNNLPNGNNSGELDFQLQLPSTITAGAGAGQSITLTFTASVAN